MGLVCVALAAPVAADPPQGVSIEVTQTAGADGAICQLRVRNAGPNAVTELRAKLVAGSITPPLTWFGDGEALLRSQQHSPEGWRSSTNLRGDEVVSWSPVSSSIELGPGAQLEFELHVPAYLAPVHCEKVQLQAVAMVPGARAKAEEQAALVLELAEPRLLAPDQIEARLLVRNASEIHAMLDLGIQAGGRYFFSQLSLVARRAGAGEPIELRFAEVPWFAQQRAELQMPLPPGATFEQRVTFYAPAPLKPGYYRVIAHLAGEPSLQAAHRSIFPGWVGAVDSTSVTLEVR